MGSREVYVLMLEDSCHSFMVERIEEACGEAFQTALHVERQRAGDPKNRLFSISVYLMLGGLRTQPHIALGVMLCI